MLVVPAITSDYGYPFSVREPPDYNRAAWMSHGLAVFTASRPEGGGRGETARAVAVLMGFVNVARPSSAPRRNAIARLHLKVVGISTALAGSSTCRIDPPGATVPEWYSPAGGDAAPRARSGIA